MALAVSLALCCLLAGGAQAARRHAAPRAHWGGFAGRALRLHEARLGRRTRRAAARRALGATGSIEGTVKDAAKGTAIAGIEVCAYPVAALEEEEESFEEGFLEYQCAEPRTDSAGEYTITGLAPGEYVVEFSTPFNSPLDYVTQFYEDASTFNESFPVTVEAGAVTGGIDAELVKGGEVEGRVTKAAGGGAIKGVEVCAWSVLGQTYACGETNSEGRYLVTGVPTGSYKVGFRSPPRSGLDYITQYYNGQATYKAANPISVKAKSTTGEINAAMALGGEIAGTVTVGETGVPSEETLVCAISVGGGEGNCEATEADGDYTVPALATGPYIVIFLTPEYPPEYYSQVFYESEEPVELHVTAPNTLGGIDAELPTLPERIIPPHVTGSPAVGSVLTCEVGTYRAVPAPTISVSWLRDGAEIPGAASATYTVQAADAGHQLQCKVTASNIMGRLWVTTAGIPIPPAAGTAVPAPVAPGGGVLPFVKVVPLVTAASRAITSRHLAAVRLKCSGGPCKGTLQLLLHVVAHHHARTLVLASASFSLADKASQNVLMRLTTAGRRRLAHAARHPLSARLKVSVIGGATSTHAILAR